MRAIILPFLVLVTNVPAAGADAPLRQAPCEAYWDADAVFVGTVIADESVPSRTVKRKGKEKPVLILDLSTKATLEVNETFRGTLDKTVTVETSKDCNMGVWWTKGKRYVVYAHRDGNRLVSSRCSRTSLIDQVPADDDDDDDAADINEAAAAAAADLAYARSKPESAALGFVQGVLLRRSADDSRRSVPVENALVKVRGLPKAVTKSNARGAFKILLPPGDHQLEIVAPGLRIEGAHPAVKIAARGACAIVEPVLIAAGIARGRLVDHERKPAVNVPVVARNAKLPWHRGAKTGADGRFEIVDIPPKMQFVLSVSAPADGGPSPANPVPTRYFPAAITEAAAKVVTVPASGIADQLDFSLAAPLRVIESTGTVKHRQRARLREAYVNVGSERVYVDERGRFKVRHFPGIVTFEACQPRINVPAECKKVERKLEAPGKVDIVLP